MTIHPWNSLGQNTGVGSCSILQEIFPTETAPYADVLLPGVTFAEKDGTFTNTERRIQLVDIRTDGDGQHGSRSNAPRRL